MPKLVGPKSEIVSNVFEHVQPEDLIHYGLIPEFVGRLPVAATLHELDEDALVRILLEPKNALVKQYKKLFGFEHVKLRFTDEALRAVAALKLSAQNWGSWTAIHIGSGHARHHVRSAEIQRPPRGNCKRGCHLLNREQCILVFEKEAETAS